MFAKKARTEAAAAAASDDSEERDVKIPVEADDEVAKAQAASDETAAEAASAEPADRDDTPEQAAASQAMTEEEMVEAAIRAGEEAAANDFKLKYEQAQNELAEVRKKLAAAEETATTADAKVREAQDRVARLQADWDNYRRRTASERLAEKSRATEKLVTALLPVLDDMERAIDHARTQEMDEAFSQFVDGVEAVRAKPYDVVLTDVRMGRMDGIHALRGILDYNPALPVVLMTAYSSVETAVDALRLGAYDYLTKPLDFDALRETLQRAVDHSRMSVENRELRRQLSEAAAGPEILGRSPAVSAMREIIATVAPTEATVLITGESGTGKELVARAVHGASARANKPLVTVNCAALAENLLESELFGHERGAFTGADRRREGRFLQADGGTLFLDEIGEMPLSLQAKLLRALQQGEVQRVGSDSPITVDVRVIAATNRNLREEVEQKRFREDLFFRLNVISIEVPALRERSEDIPLLAAHFLEKFAARNRKNVKGFAPQALDMLRRAMLGLPVEMEA